MITPELLRDVSLFDGLDDSALQAATLASADVQLEEGEWLVQEGQAAAFFVLLAGELEVTKTAGGTEHHVTTYHPGTFFGEVPLLLGSPAVANVRALHASRVMRLDAPDFHALMNASDTLASKVVRAMSGRVADLGRLAVETPAQAALIVGDREDVACYGLREFFSRNGLEYRWIDPSDANGTELPEGPSPLVRLPDGTVLLQPTPRELAEALGLQTRPPRDEYDVAIIGGGPAGLAAAVYGASEGLCTLLVEREAPGGQAGTSSRIENYLGFPSGLSGGELSARALQQARRFGADIVTTREVTGIAPQERGHCLTLDGGERVLARSVILSTGVSWRPLPLPHAQRLTGRGVYYGAARTEAPNVRGQDVYLVGGGNSAGQAAMFFASYARHVTLLIRADAVEKGMSQYLIDQLRGKRNVSFCLNTEVTALHGRHHLSAITIRDRVSGQEHERKTAWLFVFIGADAKTTWLPPEVARDERGYVLTGLDVVNGAAWPLERAPFPLESSLPGVFAAGDVRHGSVKRVAAGVGEGSMAVALIHQYLALAQEGVKGQAAQS